MTKEVPPQSIIQPENIVKDDLINRIRYLKRTIRNFTKDSRPEDILKVAVDIERENLNPEIVKILEDILLNTEKIDADLLNLKCLSLTFRNGDGSMENFYSEVSTICKSLDSITYFCKDAIGLLSQ